MGGNAIKYHQNKVIGWVFGYKCRYKISGVLNYVNNDEAEK